MATKGKRNNLFLMDSAPCERISGLSYLILPQRVMMSVHELSGISG